MKHREDQNYLVLSETYALVRGKVIQISDAGSTLSLTLKDLKKLVDFVEKQMKDKPI